MDLSQLWGKTDPADRSRFHPALYHMLDTAHVARELLLPSAPPRWRDVLASALGMDATEVVSNVPWLVAMHDIGKCSQAFQESVREQKDRLMALGLPFGRRSMSLVPHSVISAVAIGHPQAEISADLPDTLRGVMKQTVGGHHGFWLRPGELVDIAERLRQAEPAFWHGMRTQAAASLRELLGVSADWGELRNVSSAIMILSGFTILCDWLASDGKLFLPRAETPISEYLAESRAKARCAVTNAGLLMETRSCAPRSFAALFHDLPAVRPLQAAIDEIPADLFEKPTLTVIEAPTGEGKTEAALMLAHRIAERHRCDSLYYALPTMATSNQMFLRISEHIQRRLGLHTMSKLVHGQAYLIEDDLQVKPLSNGIDAEAHPSLEWFSPRKKALLAPFGVGTIDQAELAVLNVRHVALRCVGLAGKVVILDEVHAYDAYMTTIIERMLAWLRTLGASVIVLSATLPSARRRALADAWGLQETTLSDLTGAYPQLACMGEAGNYLATPRPYQESRRIALGRISFEEDQAEPKARWLLAALAGGGCGCWITNTVDQAQQLYKALRKLGPDDLDVDLVHSRFPLVQRDEIEKRIMRRYGPDSPAMRRGIVVGTQVIEQSLDLDFDLMVSDLAPVDLLLQRVGRLHRHARPGRPTSNASLWINTVGGDHADSDLGVNAVIYEELILRRTLMALEGRDALLLPGDYRAMVEQVYDERPPEEPMLQDAWAGLCARRQHAQDEARLRMVRMPDAEEPFCTPQAGFLFQEDESSARWGAAQTRLGAESVTLLPLTRDGRWGHVPGGALTCDLNREPDRSMALGLLRQSIGISHQAVVRAFKDLETGDMPLFASPLLRHVKPLWLTAGGQFDLPERGLSLVLDPELGLLIRTGRKGDTE